MNLAEPDDGEVPVERSVDLPMLEETAAEAIARPGRTRDFVLFSAATMFAILAYFLNHRRSEFSVLDRMQADAYGIFLVHYPIVLWLQYWLYDFALPAIVKASIAFIGTMLLSWGLTWVLRQIPGAKSIL